MKRISKLETIKNDKINSTVKKQIYKSILFSFLSFSLMTSCEDDKINSNTNQIENIKITEEGVVEVENSSTLKFLAKSYQESSENQNEIIEKVKDLQDKGFEPLVPIFEGDDDPKIQEYLSKKYNKIQQRKLKEGTLSKSVSEDEELTIDDEVVLDPFLTSILNEDREIIVGDSLYKYTEVGLYFSHKDNSDKLRSYVSSLNYEDELMKINGLQNNTDKPLNIKISVTKEISKFISIPSIKNLMTDEESENISKSLLKSFAENLTPTDVKRNFRSVTINRNSLWQKVFGEAETADFNYGDDRRVKVKFWNQNYFIFSSIGSSARFQKRVKFLGITGWQKSYASRMEMGVNYLEFVYNFNVPMFNQAQYNYNTVFFSSGNDHFTIDGRRINKLPSGVNGFIFDKSNPQEALNVYIFGDYLQILSAKDLNKIIDLAAKEFASNLNSIYDSKLKTKIENKEISKNVVVAVPFSNKVRFISTDVKWGSNNDNAITKYYDFNFLITWKSNYNKTTDYLGGLNGGKSYSELKVDLYGAALHNGRWGGIRLIKNVK